jgi:hypothetical protein
MKTRTIAGLLVTSLFLLSSPARADDEHKPNPDVMIALGTGIFVVSYAAAVVPTIGADAGNNHTFDALYAPLAGPFVAAVQMFTQPVTGTFSGISQAVNDFAGVLFLADGLAQVAGAIELTAGILAASQKQPITSARVSVTPLVGKSVAGVGASFAF